ncbi:hypothetical protein CDD83_6948 [Cordyceps sp. RAO-2017]|nr:hypothetical protein CDD83_6948 [Cordyceps sp. RAO-2017]
MDRWKRSSRIHNPARYGPPESRVGDLAEARTGMKYRYLAGRPKPNRASLFAPVMRLSCVCHAPVSTCAVPPVKAAGRKSQVPVQGRRGAVDESHSEAGSFILAFESTEGEALGTCSYGIGQDASGLFGRQEDVRRDHPRLSEGIELETINVATGQGHLVGNRHQGQCLHAGRGDRSLV